MPEKTILVVDHDAASRNFVSKKLEDQKFKVIQAGSAKEGLIYAWRDRPDLLIVDPVIADLRGEELAGKLRHDSRTAKLPLIALSSDPSVARVKACLDAGFNEYIPKSGQAVPQLNEAINRLLGFTEAVSRQGGYLMVFLSAKGGVGVSSICANLANLIALNLPESSVAVLDLVLPIGSIAPLVGYKGSQNVVNMADMSPAAVSPEFVRDQMPKLKDWHFHLLAGSPDPESSNHLNVNRLWSIVATLKSSFDYVLVDIGRNLSRISLPLIQNADLVSLVVSTDGGTVAMSKQVVDYLRAKGVRDQAFFPILNRAVGLEGLNKPDVEKVLGLEIKAAIPYLGAQLVHANQQHQPVSLKFPKETAVNVLKQTAADMAAVSKKLRT